MTTNQFAKLERTRVRPKVELAAALFGVTVYTSANGFMTGGLGVAGRQLGLSSVDVGLILGLGALVGVIASPAWGYAAEKWSRRTLTLCAVLMVALGPAIMAIVTGQFLLMSAAVAAFSLGAARLVQATFGAALIPVAQAYVAGLTEPARRIRGMGWLSAAISFGTLSGSILLWLTGQFGVVSGFAAIATLGIFAWLTASLYLPEALPRTRLAPDEMKLPLSAIWPYLVITFVGFTCYTTVPPIFALRLMDRFKMDAGTATAQTGLVLTVGVVAVCLAQALIAAGFFKRPLLMLRGGSIGIFGGLAMLVMAQSTLAMCLSMIVIGFAVGFLAPAVLGAISLLGGQGAQGKIGGVNMAARGLGSAAGPILGTNLYQASPDAPFWGSMALIVSVFLLTFLTRDASGRPR